MIHEHFDGRSARPVGELQDLSNRFANVLRAHGVEKGDRVAMCSPPTPETAAAFFGTWKSARSALDVGPLRRRRHPPLGHRLQAKSSSPTRRTRTASTRRWSSTYCFSMTSCCSPRPAFEREDTLAEDPAQLLPTSARPGWPRASCARTGTCSRTRVRTATTCATASIFHGMGDGRGRRHRAAARAVALRRRPSSTSARRVRPAQAAPGSSPTTSDERVHDADRDALDDDHRGRGHAATPEVPHRLQRRRAAEPRGDPLVPRAVRLTVLDYYGLTESYPLGANYPFMEVREGSMG